MPRKKFAQQAKRGNREHPLRRILRMNLRNRRVELGVTQLQLGDRVGTTQQYVQQLEDARQDNVPNLYLLHDLAQELGCTAADLLSPKRFEAGVAADDDLRVHRRKVT